MDEKNADGQAKGLEFLKGATDSEVMEWAERHLGWTRRQLRTHLVSSPEWGFNLPTGPHEAMVRFLGDISHEEFIQVFLQVTGKSSEEFRRALVEFVQGKVREREAVEGKDGRGKELLFYGSPTGRDKASAELLKDALRVNGIPFTEEIETDLEGNPELCIYVERNAREMADSIMRLAFARRDTFNGWTAILGVTSGICFVARWVFPEADFLFTALGVWALLLAGLTHLAARTIGRRGKDLPRG